MYYHALLFFCLSRSKVQSLCYAPHAKKLISCSEDGIVRIWDMNVKRQEVHGRSINDDGTYLDQSSD